MPHSMKLVVNSAAVLHSSLGVRRYYENVMRHLQWPEGVSMPPVSPSRVRARLAELALRGRPDAIMWSPCQRGPLRARHHVITVHDCINVEHTYVGDWRLPALRWASQQLLGRAERIVAISLATRAAVLRNYDIDPSSIVVIASSCQVQVGEPSPVAAPEASTETPYVLMVTNALPHKNTLRACEALIRAGAVKRRIALRVVGTIAQEAVALCHQAGLDLTLLTGISDSLLRSTYEHSLFLLSPSLDEGHNLPISEALSLGANVLCSDIAAHREFYNGLVEYFDPGRLDSLVGAIEQALNRDGRWLPEGKLPSRSFADVAADYKSLFDTM
jgi:glycosyltransferase involved in cell wall biosynthesis